MKTAAEQIMLDVQNSLGELKSSAVKLIKKKDLFDREKIQGAIGKWEIDMVSVQEQVKAHKEGMAAAMDTKAEKK